MNVLNVVRRTALAATLSVSIATADAPPQFSGTWLPDPGASTQTKTLKTVVDPAAPPAPPAAPAAIAEHLPPMRIVQQGSAVTVEFLEADGSVISSTRLTTDGAENVSPRAGGALTHRSTSSWEGPILRTTWVLEQAGKAVISGTDARELVDPGTLRVTTWTEDSKSKSESVLVYRRRHE
jgi:hypothetical protein